MKSIIMLFLFSLLFVMNLNAQDKNINSSEVETISEFKFLFRYQNFYISGQPTLEELQWLKSHGVLKIINLRSERENTEYATSAYNEETNARELGFEYYSVPVDGTNDFTPEKLNILSGYLNKEEKIVIHCLSAGRATDFFMAYLIKGRGYSVDEAITVGRSLRFSLPLEKLLDAEVSFKIKE